MSIKKNHEKGNSINTLNHADLLLLENGLSNKECFAQKTSSNNLQNNVEIEGF